MKHFLDLIDIPAIELRAILNDAKDMKAARLGWPKGKVDTGAVQSCSLECDICLRFLG